MKYLLLCLLLAGCASHKVPCDTHLEPINAPGPKVAGGASEAP